MCYLLFSGSLAAEHVLASTEGENESTFTGHRLCAQRLAKSLTYIHLIITTTRRGKFNFLEKKTEVLSLIKIQVPSLLPRKRQKTWNSSFAHVSHRTTLGHGKSWTSCSHLDFFFKNWGRISSDYWVEKCIQNTMLGLDVKPTFKVHRGDR